MKLAFRLPSAGCAVEAEVNGRRVRRIRLKPKRGGPPPSAPEARSLARALEAALLGKGAGAWRPAPDLTPFQRRVLRHVARIPPGETRTYGEVARTLRTSPRAVGRALASNPVPLLIPCHRVVAAGGLGGFSTAGGVGLKRKLLDFERRETL